MKQSAYQIASSPWFAVTLAIVAITLIYTTVLFNGSENVFASDGGTCPVACEGDDCPHKAV